MLRLPAILLCIAAVAPAAALSSADRRFLEDLSHRNFLYFWENADPGTGLVLDRARIDRVPLHPGRQVASLAATGFGLTALAMAADHRWVPQDQIRRRVALTLRFFMVNSPGKYGFYYHWLDPATGERRWESEVSSIDTALLLAGVLTVRQRFADDPEIVRLADELYRRADFTWLLRPDLTLGHGWKPESGMLLASWNSFSELMLLYILAIGSPTHPIPPETWYAWARPVSGYHGIRYVNGSAPLFSHQYSQAWIDFRGTREGPPDAIDWFENSVRATRAHRLFCMELSRLFPDYGPQTWGISASDSERGYRAWGGPPADPDLDGTLVPNAAAGSLMFTPALSLTALRTMRARYGARIYGRYGFTDAFNPLTGWTDPEVIGIDQGITLISAENLRAGTVWKYFMRNPEIAAAMQRAGLRKRQRSVPHAGGGR